MTRKAKVAPASEEFIGQLTNKQITENLQVTWAGARRGGGALAGLAPPLP